MPEPARTTNPNPFRTRAYSVPTPYEPVPNCGNGPVPELQSAPFWSQCSVRKYRALRALWVIVALKSGQSPCVDLVLLCYLRSVISQMKHHFMSPRHPRSAELYLRNSRALKIHAAKYSCASPFPVLSRALCQKYQRSISVWSPQEAVMCLVKPQ